MGLASLFAGFLAGLSSPPQAFAAENDVVRGVWYDGSTPENINDQIDKFRKLGIQRVHIVVNSNPVAMGRLCECRQEILNAPATGNCKKDLPSDRKVSELYECAGRKHYFAFDHWADEQLGNFVKQLQASSADPNNLKPGKKFEVILTVWPAPTADFIDFSKPTKHISSLRNLVDFVKKYNIKRIELEDEENWRKMAAIAGDFATTMASGKPSSPNENLDAAAQALISGLKARLPDEKIGVTFGPRDSKVQDFKGDGLLERADFIALQAYHDVKGTNCANISGNYEPGKMQVSTFDVIGAFPTWHDKELIVGLPAYQQYFRRNKGTCDQNNYYGMMNMYRALRAVMCSRGDRSIDISYWSAENLAAKANTRFSYPLTFLENCSAADIAKDCEETGDPSPEELQRACGRVGIDFVNPYP